jgi:Raf kinase inhibitor-like YbhB/YbcL family protein
VGARGAVSGVGSSRSAGLLRGSVALACVAAALTGCGGGNDEDQQKSGLPAAPETIQFTTPSFKDGGAIPADLTCDGAGKKPTIAWRGLPSGAIELVLVVEDPDAPSGTFTHWTAWGIAAAPGGGLAPDGQFPAGLKEGENSAGKPGWTPPCPPKGDDAHHYTFSLYAVPKGLTLEPGAKPDAVRAALKGALGRGTFTGTYKRAG